MRLSPPKRGTFLLATLLAILAVLSYGIVDIRFVSDYSFWLLLLAFVLLFVGAFLPGI